MAPKHKQMSLDSFAFTRIPKTPSTARTPDTPQATPAPPPLPPTSVDPLSTLPPAKRQRVEAPEQQSVHSVDGTPSTADLSRALRQHLSPHKVIPPRQPARHARFVSKLVGDDAAKGDAPGRHTAPTALKHTPLELQVVDLKRKHPGVLLMIEGVVHVSSGPSTIATHSGLQVSVFR